MNYSTMTDTQVQSRTDSITLILPCNLVRFVLQEAADMKKSLSGMNGQLTQKQAYRWSGS